MVRILFLIALTLLTIAILMCANTNQSTQVYFQSRKELKKENKQQKDKELFWFIKGIDDTCDTSKYNCIDMRKEYEKRAIK